MVQAVGPGDVYSQCMTIICMTFSALTLYFLHSLSASIAVIICGCLLDASKVDYFSEVQVAMQNELQVKDSVKRGV